MSRVTVRVVAGVVATLVVMAAPAAASWPVVFGYDGGTLAPPWQAVQSPAPDRMTVTASPTDAAKNVMRVELRHGDVYDNGGVLYNRAEVYGRFGNTGDYSAWPDGDNTERWYGWSTYLASDFPAVPVPNWTTIVQWHSMAGGTPPLSMVVQNRHFQLNAYDPTTGGGKPIWSSSDPVQTGAWHTFVLHAKWSSVPGVGFVELWFDGVQVLPKQLMATERCCAVQGTAVRPYPNYLKMGLYRNPEFLPTSILYHGPMRVGLDQGSVEPPSPGG